MAGGGRDAAGRDGVRLEVNLFGAPGARVDLLAMPHLPPPDDIAGGHVV